MNYAWRLVVSVLLFAQAAAGQQVRRLPPVDDDAPGEVELLAWFPEQRPNLANPALVDGPPEPLPPPDPTDVPGTRKGAFQKVVLEAAWLGSGTGPDDVGMNDFEAKAVLGFPCPTRNSPLVVTPGYAVHWFDGPSRTDLPPATYDSYAQFRWLSRIGARWGVDVAVTPGWYSDYEQGSWRAFRVTGYGAGAYTWSPVARFVLGAAWLDRDDVPVLPIGGVILTPNEDTTLELLAPRPRIARRVYWSGNPSPWMEDWIYFGGEMGGGTWAVQRANGAEDVLNTRDYRVILGIERKKLGGMGLVFEAGYVFGRRLEYNVGEEVVRPSDTVMLRGSLTY